MAPPAMTTPGIAARPPRYMDRWLWELAVNFNEHSYAGDKTGKVVPDTQGNLRRIISESKRALAYQKTSVWDSLKWSYKNQPAEEP